VEAKREKPNVRHVRRRRGDEMLHSGPLTIQLHFSDSLKSSSSVREKKYSMKYSLTTCIEPRLVHNSAASLYFRPVSEQKGDTLAIVCAPDGLADCSTDIYDNELVTCRRPLSLRDGIGDLIFV
jgi:hypothetical protein